MTRDFTFHLNQHRLSSGTAGTLRQNQRAGMALTVNQLTILILLTFDNTDQTALGRDHCQALRSLEQVNSLQSTWK